MLSSSLGGSLHRAKAVAEKSAGKVLLSNLLVPNTDAGV